MILDFSLNISCSIHIEGSIFLIYKQLSITIVSNYGRGEEEFQKKCLILIMELLD